MADFIPIKNIIDAALALDMGNPNFSISDKERLLKDSAILLGCLDYYRVWPLRVTYMTTYNSMGGSNTSFNWGGMNAPKTENGSMYIPFEDFFTQGTPAVPEEQLRNAYFLGIMRMERPAWSNWSNPSMWEQQMFGFPVSGTYQFDITQQLVSNTYDELSTGQPSYVINRMKNRVEILQPWGMGQLSIFAGIGFTTPDYVEYSQVDNLCKFISYRFIEAVIQARSGIELDADFKISVEALKVRLEKLKAEIDSFRNHTVLNYAIWN